MESNRLGEHSWATLVRRNEPDLSLPKEVEGLPKEVFDQAFYEIKYDGYLQRELRQIENLSNVESVRVPAQFDFLTVKGLKKESAIKLNELRPVNLGQASRVSGVNPTDISILWWHLEIHKLLINRSLQIIRGFSPLWIFGNRCNRIVTLRQLR